MTTNDPVPFVGLSIKKVCKGSGFKSISRPKACPVIIMFSFLSKIIDKPTCPSICLAHIKFLFLSNFKIKTLDFIVPFKLKTVLPGSKSTIPPNTPIE